MTDSTLRQDIIDELDFEPSIDSADIGVAVENGIVTLTGHVPTYAQKVTVEDVVRRVKGVKGIAEEIEVRPFGTNRTADDEIAKRAVNTINWNTSVPNSAVRSRCEGLGYAHRQGRVAVPEDRSADALRFSRVSSASEPDRDQAACFGLTSRNIQDALKRNAEIEAQAIKVNVLIGQVTLEGRVHAWSSAVPLSGRPGLLSVSAPSKIGSRSDDGAQDAHQITGWKGNLSTP